ncbi:MAG TPA: J domain-containing protein [Gaiellaceae bacterium]|nr:J domain-containing protein [Gaiellaceae bacterium]
MIGHVNSGAADVSQYYRVLGLAPTASAKDIRQAFRTLVRRYHPDANPTARAGGELAAVVEAYRRIGRRTAPPAAASAPPAAAVPRRHIDVYA